MHSLCSFQCYAYITLYLLTFYILEVVIIPPVLFSTNFYTHFYADSYDSHRPRCKFVWNLVPLNNMRLPPPLMTVTIVLPSLFFSWSTSILLSLPPLLLWSPLWLPLWSPLSVPLSSSSCCPPLLSSSSDSSDFDSSESLVSLLSD